jgi:hypothetical protein
MAEPHLTPRQQKWFATVQANLERDTGKSLAEWIAIARTCPETGHRKRQAWLKEHHGLMINRASYVLSEAFGSEMPWEDTDLLVDTLWTDPSSRAIFKALRAKASALPDVVVGPRKGFTAFSRNFQFAAAKPVRGGAAILGLAVAPEADPGLIPRRKSEPLNERLLAIAPLASVAEVDGRIEGLLRQAWERS